jgi:hypothetical protein
VAQHLIAARTTENDGDLACDWRFDAQPEPGKDVRVQVNGLPAVVGDGTRIGAPCYFSGDGGTTARKRQAVMPRDTLHWNGSVAKYELAPSDQLTIEFEITQLTPASLPKWRKLIANDSLMVALAVSVTAYGVIHAYLSREPSWFARAGGLLVAIGINLVARATITGVDLRPTVIGADTGMNVNSPEHYYAAGEPVPPYVIEDQRTRRAIGVVGPIISFAGTLIWAYGDVVLCRVVSTLNCASVP